MDILHYYHNTKSAKREVYINGTLNFVVNYDNMTLTDAMNFADKHNCVLMEE